jgi:membrane protease YdiL (CAAX protease family)
MMSSLSGFIFIVTTFLMPFVFIFMSIYLIAFLYKLATGEFKKVLSRAEMQKAPWTFLFPMLLFWVAAPILWRIFIDGKSLAEIGFSMGTKPLFYFSLSVVLSLFIGYLASRMGEKVISKESTLYFISSFVLVALTEESLMRLFVGGRFYDIWGLIPATLISSIYFVIFHLQHPEVSISKPGKMIPYLLSVFGVGVFLALLYFYSHSIWPPFISHLIINCVSSSNFEFFRPKR